MSRYLGKLLIEGGGVSASGFDKVSVKYVFSSDMFCFKCEGERNFFFRIGREMCQNLVRLCAVGTLECQYRWSVGYVVREKKGIEEFVSMRNSELDLLGGRRKLVMSGQLDNDDDFDNLCVIQHLYQFSEVTLKEIKKQWKRFKWKKASSPYLELTRREPHKGREVGSKNKVEEKEDFESVEDVLFRCEHNKKSALEKGILGYYLEAEKERCKVLNLRFDKDKVLQDWNQEREKEV